MKSDEIWSESSLILLSPVQIWWIQQVFRQREPGQLPTMNFPAGQKWSSCLKSPDDTCIWRWVSPFVRSSFGTSAHFPLTPQNRQLFFFLKKKKKGTVGQPSTGFAEVRVDESLEWCSRTTYMGPVQWSVLLERGGYLWGSVWPSAYSLPSSCWL